MWVAPCRRLFIRSSSVQNSLLNRAQSTQTSQDKSEDKPRQTIPHRSSYTREACDSRRHWVEEQTGMALPGIGQWLPDQDTTQLKGNIEIPCGTVKVPVAVLGPLKIQGEHAQGEFFAPFATTEGALTASAMRGVSAVNASGGAMAWTGEQQMTRGPYWVTGSPSQAVKFANWVMSKRQQLQEDVVSKVSQRAVLKNIIPVYDMEACHLSFQYSSGDASGQNMATSCTWAIMKWLGEHAKVDLPEVEIKHAWTMGNLDGDKKHGLFSLLTSRGISAQAQCILSEEVLNNKLRITSHDYLTFAYYGTRMSTRVTPGGGINVNTANTLAAIFIATGQDAAAVVDSTCGATLDVSKHEGEGGGVLASLTIPNLIVGTVGGGTGLPTQAESLAIMDCVGTGKVRKFAEIITSYALCLDISLSTAVVGGIFAESHDRFGRNRPGA